MRRIILPTDFSNNSIVGLKYAINLYGTKEAKYFIVNAVEPPKGRASVFMSLIERLDRQSQEQLIDLSKAIKEWNPDPDLEIELITVHGDIMSNMEDLVVELDATSIFMGTKGRGDVAGKLIGSNTFKVLKSTSTPFYIIPKHTKVEKPKKIGFASDLSEISPELVANIVEFTKRHNAKLEIVNILIDDKEVDKKEVERYDTHFRGIDHEFHFIHGHNFAEDLKNFASKEELDMLIMVRHNHSFFDRLFGVSHTREMTLVSDIPLLMLKE